MKTITPTNLINVLMLSICMILKIISYFHIILFSKLLCDSELLAKQQFSLKTFSLIS
jgi:hypothetical protein